MRKIAAAGLFFLAIAQTQVASAAQTAPHAAGTAFGQVRVRTLALPAGLIPSSGTYTPSGKILLAYRKTANDDPRQVNLAVLDDDGRGLRIIFSGKLPERPKDNGIRYMVFSDNRRVFLGDFVLECAPSLDACAKSTLLPVQYPAPVAEGDHIAHRWSEVIVAPDNRHVAWTTLLSNYAAVVLTGELRRRNDDYVIAKPRIVSTLDPFKPDPRHADGVVPQTIRGGEVKQFVDGGQAISLAGAARRDLPDSVVQHLATGRVEPITDTPGYTETTIFSPDEALGLTMTTRFSTADPAILGLLPKPYPASLNMGLSMFAYTYAVTGVRTGRQGDIGPALIAIDASKTQDGYTGVDLSTARDWVFRSPMSWHPGGKKGMWVEGLRGGDARRIQIVELPDYRPGPVVKARPTPDVIPEAASDLSVIPGLVKKTRDIDVKVYGRASGYIQYRRTAATIDKTYIDFSDDGKNVYSGQETMRSNPRGTSVYVARIKLAGIHAGAMDLQVTFGPLGGDHPAALVFAPDASGQPASRGYAEYDGRRLNVDSLQP